MNATQILARLQSANIRRDFLIIVEYTNTRLEIVFSDQSRPRHYIFDLNGDCSSQIFDLLERESFWEIGNPHIALGRRFLPYHAGVGPRTRQYTRSVEYVDYTFFTEDERHANLRLHWGDNRNRITGTGIQIARAVPYQEKPIESIASFDHFHFFNRVRQGEFLTFEDVYDNGMTAAKLPYRCHDDPYVFHDIIGDIRHLRDQHLYHLAYSLANRVEVERRLDAIATITPRINIAE